MVGARRQRARALGERRRGAGVRLEPPGLAGPVVDRAAHERMAEAVAAGDVGRAGDVGGQQLVDRGQRRALVHAGGGAREVEVERLARDGGAPAEPPGRLRQAGDLLAERGGHGRRHADVLGLLARLARRSGRPRQLLEVERVAAALAVDGGQRRRAEEGVGLRLGERPEPDLAHHPVAARLVERGQQGVGHLPGAEGERDQHGSRRRAAQQVGDQLERGVVGPVHVVEHQDDGVAHRHPLQQRAHRAVGMEALVLQAARSGSRRRGRRQHAGELGHALADQRVQLALAQRGDVVVERVDPDRERQLALQLGSAAHEHGVPALGGALGELPEQPRLADPRLAADHQPAGAAGAEAVQRRVHRRQLLAAPDKSLVLRLRYRRHFRRDPIPPLPP